MPKTAATVLVAAETHAMAIDRCYCQQVTFDEIKLVAEGMLRDRGDGPTDATTFADRASALDLNELCDRAGCGQCCGLCRPYIRVMLRTGVTTLPVLSAEEIDRLGAPTGAARPV